MTKKEKMLKRMEQIGYHKDFKEKLLNLWDFSESTKLPSMYYADVGSIVINGLHISNGVGDGAFGIGVVDANDTHYLSKTEGYTDTGIFFYSDCIRIRLYDLLPESEFKYDFKNIKWGKVLKNETGNFLIVISR